MASETTLRPQESLRRTLLDASLELIASVGLEGFSMREVARRAGVSHQAPYHHFEDREAILAAIVAEGFKHLGRDSLAAIEGVEDVGDRLIAIGKAYVLFALNNPAHFKLMFRSEHVREEDHQEAKARAQDAFDVLLSVSGDVAREGGHSRKLVLLNAWSFTHGLATLLLEGKLDRAIPVSERVATVGDALEFFAGQLRPRA